MSNDFPRASSVGDFCRRWRMARSTYYRRLARGQVPDPVHIGARTMILETDEQAWVARLRDGAVGAARDTSRATAASTARRKRRGTANEQA